MKCVTPQLIIKRPNARKMDGKGISFFAFARRITRKVDMAMYDRPMDASEIKCSQIRFEVSKKQ
jgi:hypothetical protein